MGWYTMEDESVSIVWTILLSPRLWRITVVPGRCVGLVTTDPSLGFLLPDEMDQTPPVRSEYLVSGIRTPPVRRNSKLATLGRIFKPWKWRKKKNEKLKQTTSGEWVWGRGLGSWGRRPAVAVTWLSFADVGRGGLCPVAPMTGAVQPPAGPFLLWSLQVPGWGCGISPRHTHSPCPTQTPRGTHDPLDLVENADSGSVQGQSGVRPSW